MAGIKRANTSGITKTGTAIPDVPDAPTIGTATDPGTDGYATVAFTPAVTGGTVANYTATSTPGSITATSATSPITVTGLTVNTSYTFKVKGTNATATGPESAASSSFTPTPHNSYESIQTVTVGAGGSSSISFTSIPSTYKHLQIRALCVMSGSVGSGLIAFNGDNASGNYSYHAVGADGTSPGTAALASQNQGKYTGFAGTSSAANNVMVMDILDYANTNKFKTAKAFYCWDANGTGYVEFNSNLWRNTGAITSIVFTPANTFAQYSSFALYGVRG